MKKITLLVTVLFCIVLLIVGCSSTKGKAPEEPWTGLIMADGEIYAYTGDEVPVEIDKSSIIGKVTSIIKYYETPSEDGQANFEIKGSKYAPYEDNMVVLINNEWILFLNEEDWGKGISIQFDGSLEEEIFGDLSQENIAKLMGRISLEIKKDKNYFNNLDTIIENSFRKFGIEDNSNLEYAKNYLKITVTDSK